MAAEIRTAQNSFVSGEISPEMYGRLDTAAHQAGLKKCANAVITPFGGVSRRGGTKFINAAKYPDKNVRLFNFTHDVSQSYLIEMGDLYIRFYINGHVVKNDDGSAFEVTTTYTESELSGIKIAQKEDYIFIVHPDHPVAQLVRYADNDWRLSTMIFSPAPYEETTPTPVGWLRFSTSNLKVDEAFTFTLYQAITQGSVQTGTSADGHPAYTTMDTSKPVYPLSQSDVGARVSVNSGVLEITAVSNKNPSGDGYSTATGVIKYALSSTVTAQPYAWAIQHIAWGDDLGYPSTVFVYQQRLILAGSKKFPRRIWMSVIGNVFNFDLANADANDALSFNVDDNQGNNIVQLVQNQVLLVITTGGEFAITGGSDKGITPSNVTARLQSSIGASSVVPPCNIDGAAVFVQRAGKQVKYVVNSGYYGTEAETLTLSMLSRHLLEPNIIDMTYQQSPNSRLFCVLADGNMAVLTHIGEQKILGWSRVTTQGSFISACVVPSLQADDCYIAVKRNINGTVNTFIEKFSDEVNTDCSILGETSEGAAVWGGLDHLEGQLVDIVADGVVMPPAKVTDGKIALTREAYKVEFGINYTTELQFLFQDLPTQIGTIIGKRMKIHDITLRLYNTIGAVLYNLNGGNEVVLSNRRFGKGLLDEPPGVVDSTIKSNPAGWGINEINLVIKQTDPLPLTLLSLAYTIQS